MNDFNRINNKNIIPFKNCFFSYVGEKDNQIFSPANNYYFNIDDLSVNLLIFLKWVLYRFFLKSIAGITAEEELPESCSQILSFKNLQFKKTSEPYKISIDGYPTASVISFKNILAIGYTNGLFNANSKIILKLKLGLKDYLLLQNTHRPILYFYKRRIGAYIF